MIEGRVSDHFVQKVVFFLLEMKHELAKMFKINEANNPNRNYVKI